MSLTPLFLFSTPAGCLQLNITQWKTSIEYEQKSFFFGTFSMEKRLQYRGL
jgi:hypothetical protein